MKKATFLFAVAALVSACGFESTANAQYPIGGRVIRGTYVSGWSNNAPGGVIGAFPSIYPGRTYNRPMFNNSPWTQSTYAYNPYSNSWNLQNYYLYRGYR